MSSALYRTYSSPSLRARGRSPSDWEYQQYKYGYDTEDEEFYVIGDRVFVDGYKTASVAYFGEVEFSSGDWVGVVLDEPLGNHNGRVHGREYFQCPTMHGLFVRPSRVSRMPDSALGSSASSSRISTPIPSFQRLGRTTSKSPGNSTLDSYFYDEDYKVPTVASLERKLRSIEMRPPSSLGDKSFGGRFSTNTPTTGILKRGSRALSTGPSISSKTSELSNRIDAIRSSPTTVFNFRPKRAQLDEFERSDTPVSNRRQTSAIFDLSKEPPRLGDRVTVQTERGPMTGVLRFMGETKFATGEWAGIELDHPDGKNDGCILDHRYFYCPKNHGLFTPASRVRKSGQSNVTNRSTNDSVFNAMRSTIKSPPPYRTTIAGAHDSQSATPSYEENNPSRASDRSDSTHGFSSAESPISSQGQYKDWRQEYSSSPMTDATYDFTFDSSSKYKPEESPKFDNRDIEFQLRRSLNRPIKQSTKLTHSIADKPKPRSVKYTFSSSKYDGNPIARRTLEYD